MEFVAVTADTAARWQAVEAAAFDHDFVGLPSDPVGEVLAALASEPAAGSRTEFVLGSLDGLDVVAAKIHLPVRDNLDEASLTVSVHPAARRRGHGTRGVEALVARCRELGRTRLLAEVPGSLRQAVTPVQVWAAQLGFVPKLAEVRRCLNLDTLEDRPLAELEREAAGHAAGYRLLSWTRTAPAAQVPGLTTLSQRMALDAPMGELTREPEDWDPERWLANERDTIAKNRLRLGSMALRGEEVVAYTDIGINQAQPQFGYQWDTIVRADHRGHRLGMLVKIANLRQLREQSPTTQWLNTWNALDNTYMASINEAIGWHPVDTWTESQRDL